MHVLSRKIIKETVQAGTKLGWDQFLFMICSILTKICSIFFMICSILNNIRSFLSSSRRSQISANTTEHIAALISSALSLSTTYINLRTIHCTNKRLNTPMWRVTKKLKFLYFLCNALVLLRKCARIYVSRTPA